MYELILILENNMRARMFVGGGTEDGQKENVIVNNFMMNDRAVWKKIC